MHEAVEETIPKYKTSSNKQKRWIHKIMKDADGEDDDTKILWEKKSVTHPTI